jgi:tetratricopeptide (TPR) repeat protein
MKTEKTKKQLPTYEQAKAAWQKALRVQASALEAQQLAQMAYKKAVADSDKAYQLIQKVLEHDGTLPEYDGEY